MKIVVSLNRAPGELLPAPRQIRLAVGSAVKEAMEGFERHQHSPWMTYTREVKAKR